MSVKHGSGTQKCNGDPVHWILRAYKLQNLLDVLKAYRC